MLKRVDEKRKEFFTELAALMARYEATLRVPSVGDDVIAFEFPDLGEHHFTVTEGKLEVLHHGKFREPETINPTKPKGE